MNPLPQIRAASRGDIAGIAELARRVWRAHYPGIITAAQIEYMLERGYAFDALARFVDGPDAGIDLACVDDVLAGFCAWMLLGASNELKIDKLYVDVDLHRGGIGGALIDAARDHACRTGARALVLNVNKNNERAIAAYRKHGFRVRESVVIDIGGGFVMDDFVMERTV